MWELSADANWYDETKPKKFEDWEDAQWAFRGAVTKALGKDRKHLNYFLDLIDKYFAKSYGKAPLPKGVEQFKAFLTKYVTDPTYPADASSLTIETFEDDNLKICYEDNRVQLQAKDNEIVGEIPVAMIPVELEESMAIFILSNNPTIIFPVPGTKTVKIILEAAEDEEEDDYDEDDDEDYDEDYDDEEEDDDDDEEAVTRSYAPPRPCDSKLRYHSRSAPPAPQGPKPLSMLEKSELRRAQSHYDFCVRQHARAKVGNVSPGVVASCEAAEKEAFARLMAVQAKYAGRE